MDYVLKNKEVSQRESKVKKACGTPFSLPLIRLASVMEVLIAICFISWENGRTVKFCNKIAPSNNYQTVQNIRLKQG